MSSLLIIPPLSEIHGIIDTEYLELMLNVLNILEEKLKKLLSEIAVLLNK
jgi:hypothetical protein